MKVQHFYAYGDIGECDPYFKVFTGSDDPALSSKKIADFLNGLAADVTDIHIHINSRGGSVNEGFAIHDLLVNCGKVVTTIVEGQAASIASVVLLAGSVRQITENSTVMIHNPWIDPWSMGGSLEADDVQAIADQMKAMETKMLDMYANKTGSDRAALEAYMKEETSFDAAQALELKFCTEILKPVKAVAYIKPKQKEETKIMSKILEQLNALATKLGIKAEETTPVAKALDAEDGKSYSVDGEVVVGSVVKDEAGNPVVSQTIKLKDGSSVTTDADGKISAVTPAPEAAEKTPAVIALEKELSDVKAENKTLKDQVAAQAKETESIQAQINLIAKSIKSEHIVATGNHNEFRTGKDGKKPEFSVRDAFKKSQEARAKK